MNATYTNLLLIDNNDSFTYNVVNILRRIQKLKYEIISYNSLREVDLNKFRRIIISPGPGNPAEYYYQKILEFVIDKNVPLLGICLGHQIIAQYFGANIINLNNVFHGQNKIIKHDNSELYKNLPRKFQVGVYHSWAVSRENFPEKILKITATSEDNIIMSIQHKKYNIFGVQFHPESYITQYGEKIIENFVHI